MDWSKVKAISFPFAQDVFGVTASTSNQAKIYLDRLLTLLSTNKGQRPMLPDYGTDVGAALFENDNDFPAAIEVAITNAIARWMPDVSLANIEISELNTGQVNVSVTILLPNGQSTSLTVNSAVFNADGTIDSTGI